MRLANTMLIMLSLLLVAGCSDTAPTLQTIEAGQTARTQSDCTTEAIGTVFAAVEGDSRVGVISFTGIVESVTPRGDRYHDRIVVIADGKRYTVLFSAPDKQLPVVVSKEYTFEIHHQGGFPSANSIVLSDGDGMIFTAVTDWSLGANVLRDGPSGFKLSSGPGDCNSRTVNSCYESIIHTQLSVYIDGANVTLLHGESGRISGYLVRCLTCQEIVYTATCADAGLSGVSYFIERATD
jgi:hypothetical protein